MTLILTKDETIITYEELESLRTRIADLELSRKSFEQHHVAQTGDLQDRIDELETFIKKVADQAICRSKATCACPHCANAREAQGLIDRKSEVE